MNLLTTFNIVHQCKMANLPNDQQYVYCESHNGKCLLTIWMQACFRYLQSGTLKGMIGLL
jgi:hypothetical protein